MGEHRAELFLCALAIVACKTDKGGPTATASASASASAPSAVEEQASAPALPKAGLELHVVATSTHVLVLDVIDDAALLYRYDPGHDAYLLQQHRFAPLPGLFSGVDVPEGWSFGPVEGHWPDLTTLTIADRGYMGHAKDVKLFRKSGARWVQMPGAVGKSVVTGFAGQSLFVEQDDGPHFYDAAGHEQKLAVQKSVDGEDVTFLGASKDASGRIFVSGFVPNAPKDAGLELHLSSGGGVPGGVAVIERWEPGATSPVVDRMPDPRTAWINALNGDTVFSAGERTFAVFGQSRTLARFNDRTWSIEPLPIDAKCSGVYDFTVAKDGTIFFGATDCNGGDAIVRRSVDGRYDRIVMPVGVGHRSVYAESRDAVWVLGDQREASAMTLYFTQPLGPVVTIP